MKLKSGPGVERRRRLQLLGGQAENDAHPKQHACSRREDTHRWHLYDKADETRLQRHKVGCTRDSKRSGDGRGKTEDEDKRASPSIGQCYLLDAVIVLIDALDGCDSIGWSAATLRSPAATESVSERLCEKHGDRLLLAGQELVYLWNLCQHSHQGDTAKECECDLDASLRGEREDRKQHARRPSYPCGAAGCKSERHQRERHRRIPELASGRNTQQKPEDKEIRQRLRRIHRRKDTDLHTFRRTDGRQAGVFHPVCVPWRQNKILIDAIQSHCENAKEKIVPNERKNLFQVLSLIEQVERKRKRSDPCDQFLHHAERRVREETDHCGVDHRRDDEHDRTKTYRREDDLETSQRGHAGNAGQNRSCNYHRSRLGL